MLVTESDCQAILVGSLEHANVESNCHLGLRSVLRHCAVGAGRLRPLVGHAVGISASFFGMNLTRLLDGILIIVGVPGLVDSFARFALEGLGTPAPIAPTQKL